MKRTVFAALILLLSITLLSGCEGAATAVATTPEPSVTPEPTPEPTPCPHRNWVDGVCADCGALCSHSWQDGVCTICALRCSHGQHDAETGICPLCGETAVHRYRDGRCLVCGREPDFIHDLLPAEAFAPCEHAGTVVTHDYRFAYAPGYELERTLDVYLPYGYDPAQRYNVLVLIHGGGGSSHDFTDMVFENAELGYSFCMKALYDRMIEEKRCEPLIVISPFTCSFRSQDVPGYLPDAYFAKELREYILPYAAETYSTYAFSGAEEDLRAARDHFGIGGVSNGSLFAYDAGMNLCFDLFSQYICLSGNDAPGEIAERINREDWAALPIRLYYAGSADGDNQQYFSHNGFDIITGSTERLIPEQNSFYVDIHGFHNWSQWAAHLYNVLPLVFPPEE